MIHQKLTVLSLLLLLFSCTAEEASQKDRITPKVLDERLELTLFTEDPDIHTPIGIAVDSQDYIYVLESHTHNPPPDYDGPPGDLVKVFIDNDRDGTPDESSVFAEGFKDGMMMAFSPEDVLYLVTSRAVWALNDENNDGFSSVEEQEKVLELTKPESVYPHAALLGITFSHDGWMYISRGNVGSAYWLVTGSDGSSIEGYGDGGNIIRARADGSQVKEVATGFWNPFDLKFDKYGRLLAADNDPDSRGPNRLLHIIPGGDYGYKSLYGGSGIHPYSAWNGELPGTLPYAAGLGEAPSGLMETWHTSLPQDYEGEILSSIWEESRIVRIRLTKEGASVKGETQTIIEGGQDFRPVAFAADSEGSVYITDWVLRDYPNHGRGRIWKLTSTTEKDMLTPNENRYGEPKESPNQKELDDIYNSGSSGDFEFLLDALTSGDPFIKNASIFELSNRSFQEELIEATEHSDPEIRLGSLVALQRSDYNDGEAVAKAGLSDPDPRIRRQVLIWIGSEFMVDLRPHLERALTTREPTPELFETYLETVRNLQPEFVEMYKNRSENLSRNIPRPLPENFIEKFIRNESYASSSRALALKYLTDPSAHQELILSFLELGRDTQLQFEAIQVLAQNPGPEIGERLLEIAIDVSYPEHIRAEALLSLQRQPMDASAEVLPLLDDSNPDIKIEAVRYLRLRLSSEGVRETLKEKYETISDETRRPLKEQIALAFKSNELPQPKPNRPVSVSEWQSVLMSTNGNSERGRRVFFSIQSTCSSCHAAAGRGGELGPDLSNVGQSKNREQLIQSILQPSDKISPEWQGWYVEKNDGTVYRGRQIDIRENSIHLYTEHEGFVAIDKSEVVDYGTSETSLMPRGLETQLTLSDLQDLITWLEDQEKVR